MFTRWKISVMAMAMAFLLSVAVEATAAAKIGVLLANHGSAQKTWRDQLYDLDDKVRDRILANPAISGVKTAFMEYEGASIADQMKAFDAEGFDEIIIVPLFISVSSHTNTDIPHIVGLTHDLKAVERLRERENIEVYKPKAKVTITSTLDATIFLTKNIVTRTKRLLKEADGKNFGVTLAAYGDIEFNEQWEGLMTSVGKSLMAETGIDMVNYAWSGHLVNYSIDPTKNAINQVLSKKKEDILISVYVAYDFEFQTDVIGKAAKNASRPEDVRYTEMEAILPDADLNNWVVEIVNETLEIREMAGR